MTGEESLSQLAELGGVPLVEACVVLFALLLAGGLGSLASSRIRTSGGLVRLQTAAGLGVVALAGIYGFALGPLLHSTMGLPLAGRMAFSAGLVALPGLARQPWLRA